MNVSIWVADSVDKDWIPHLKNAVEQINIAAPGLNLEFVSDRDAAKPMIKIRSVRDDKRKTDAKETEAYTYGNIVHYDVVRTGVMTAKSKPVFMKYSTPLDLSMSSHGKMQVMV